MSFTIGDAIRKKILEKGISFVAFANKFGMTDRNLQNFFKRNDISMQQIIRASEILDHDFITEYLRAQKKTPAVFRHTQEPREDYDRKSPELISFTIHVKGTFQDYTQSFPKMLSELKQNVEQYGFKLS